ncbi:NUDIX domain-containing protein [Georgenia sp. 311]|uniref:NUDIX hydrolase n=1 Tax=Georgenia sp. 311 TaxID=2585134 RepID=UPI00111242F3|nr:NUDIX domain-containing protein [Georgenia sp. 311]TNC18342.1 NUDIX domain-containing protein [Georgenia sp. 311]
MSGQASTARNRNGRGRGVDRCISRITTPASRPTRRSATRRGDRPDLVQRRFRPGQRRLVPPRGGVEYDKGVDDAVVREVHEDTWYSVRVRSFLLLHHFVGPTSWRGSLPYRSQRLVFRAEILGGQVGTVEVGGTTDFARWVPRADFPCPSPRPTSPLPQSGTCGGTRARCERVPPLVTCGRIDRHFRLAVPGGTAHL